jgi:Reverse transcriptase (RNA-dependent DNA polymerase)
VKTKSLGIFQARVNARSCKQIDGIHYDSSHIAAPVTNDVTIRIMFTMAKMAKRSAYLIDISGAYLNGRFEQV